MSTLAHRFATPERARDSRGIPDKE